MVLDDQALRSRAGFALKEQRCRQAADPTADDDAIVVLTRVDYLFRQWIVQAIADRMSGLKNLPRISIGVAVFADATVAGEVVVVGQEFCGSRAPEEHRSGRQQGGAEEIPPRDSLIHPESMITGMNFRSKVRFMFPRDVA